jgi:hypothetical protein
MANMSFISNWKKVAYGAFFGPTLVSGDKKRGFCRLVPGVATPEAH